jgi:hypothetical protein
MKASATRSARPRDRLRRARSGRPDRREVFLNAQKVNTQADVLASDGAILMSMLLQYGCPPADIAHAMKRNPDGSPASPLGRAAAFLIEGER